MTKNKIYHLLEMTIDDWIRNSDFDLPFEVKSDFVFFIGYLERILSDRYDYETEWDRHNDVFVRFFNNSPIDRSHRKIELRVSFHKRFVQVGYYGRMICNMYISYAKTPIVEFGPVPNTWNEVRRIQAAFNQLFRNIFKKENVHE